MGLKYVGERVQPHLNVAFNEFVTRPTDFIGTQVMPILPVTAASGTFGRVTRESLLKAETNIARAAGGAYPEIDVTGEEDTYATKGYGLKVKLPEEQIAQYRNFFDAEMSALNRLSRVFLTAHERRVAAKLQDTTVFTGSDLYADVSGTEPWDDPTKDIIGVVTDAVYQVWSQTGVEANALIINRQQLNWILNNDDVKAKFPGAVAVTRGMVESMLPAIFGLEKLVVSRGIYDSADQGQNFTGATMWSSLYASVALINDPGDGLDMPGIGRTLQWDAAEAGDGNVVTYWDDDVDSWYYKKKYYTDEKVFDPYFGFLLKVDA